MFFLLLQLSNYKKIKLATPNPCWMRASQKQLTQVQYRKQITHVQYSSFVVKACANPFQIDFQFFFWVTNHFKIYFMKHLLLIN